MKITCNSCGSKYTIADAKVLGKKVKVRCKGCKESILVDGTQLSAGGDDDDDSDAPEVSSPTAAEDSSPEGAAAPKAAAAPQAAAGPKVPTADPAKKGLWSVNLSDDDSRDMTLAELVAGWKNGTVTPDAYVWKDGMGDWKPILEVGELKLKLGPAPKKGAGVASSAVAPAAAGKAADKMDDLFGGVDVAGSPEPNKAALGGGADAKPTGARNDSSVLFSLDSLTGGDAGPGGPKANETDIFGGMSGGGIGGLGSNMDLLTAPAKEPPPAPAGVRASPAAAPIATASGGKSKTPIIVAAILGVAILGAGAVFALGGSGDESAGNAEEVAAAKAEAEKIAEEKKKLEEEKKRIEEEKKKAEEEKKKLEAELKKKEEAGDKKEDETKEEEKKEEAAGSSSSSSTSTSSSDKKPDEAPSPAPSSGGGAPFNVGAAKAALSAAAANAAGCGKPGGPTGAGRVQLTFANSGRVTSAQVVSGPFGGTAVGGCVASAFRRAVVPPFGGDPKTVSKSFKIQ